MIIQHTTTDGDFIGPHGELITDDKPVVSLQQSNSYINLGKGHLLVIHKTVHERLFSEPPKHIGH